MRQLDWLAEPALRKALESKPPLESRRRIEELLAEYQGPAVRDETRQIVRVVAVLEHMGSDGAGLLLAKLADGAPEAHLTHEARAALDRLSRRPTP